MRVAIISLSALLFVAGSAEAIPNPASVYCTQLGYNVQTRTDEHGNQYGVCVFPDGNECEAWAFYRKCYLGDPSANCNRECEALPCRQAGESVLIGECCEGLSSIRPAYTYGPDCNDLLMVGWTWLCSDCGNGICESWENKCNCPEDCKVPKVIYVDDDANGTNDGTSWANAYRYLQDALADANTSEKPIEIRVAQGIYKPDQGVNQAIGDREATLHLISGVTLRGGYAGFGEPDPNARDIDTYETILSGDLNGNDIGLEDSEWQNIFDFLADPNRSENSHTIVTSSGTDSTAILDGFTITAGHANTCDIEPNGCHTEPNSPKNNGAGMYVHACSPTLINCTFYRNMAQVTECCGAGGGGIFSSNSNPTLRDCKFIQNVVFGGNAASHGGGMYNINSNPMLNNCLFVGNIAMGYDSEYYGGGMCNKSSSPQLANCLFICNIADWGGAVSNDAKSNMTLRDCTFSGNSANDDGGAISTTAKDANFVNCTFEDNAAWSYGGGISCSGNLMLTDCTFRGNRSPTGGGMCIWFLGRATLKNCTFSGNTAGDGGGIYNGGGWYDDPNSTTELTDCIFSRNSAYWGGGMYNAWNRGTIVTNCVFSGNSARQGGGIYNCASRQNLRNCTFTGNSAHSGNALACDWCGADESSKVEAVNCIFWDGGNELFNGDDSEILVTFSNIRGRWPGEGNMDADPCFVDPGYWDPNGTPDDPNDDFWINGDYHLKSQAGRSEPAKQAWVKDNVTSPCVDAGDSMSPIGLEPFPNGGRINMGAYGGTAEASKSYFGEPPCETIIAGDINGDCKVDWHDLAIMAFHWLQCTE